MEVKIRKIIRQFLKEHLLSEKLTDVDSDVDLLYDKYFKDDIDEIQVTGIITKNMFKPDGTNTSILRDDISVRANELNYCIININDGSNYYGPSINKIGISVNDSALNFVRDDFNGNLKDAIDYLNDDRQKKSLMAEFTEEKIKGSIHHELAHWIDDTMNNQHLKRRMIKAVQQKTRDLGGLPVDATKMEIQGQIHNVKQLYNKYNDIWNTLSFDDLIGYSPSLSNIYRKLPYDLRNKWLRNLKTRMYREGLLGDMMY